MFGAAWYLYFRNQAKLQNIGDALSFKLQKPGRILNVELQNVGWTMETMHVELHNFKRRNFNQNPCEL